MTDNNDNKRTVEQIIAAAIDRHDSQDAPRTITPDQLRAMAADRQRRKRRRLLQRAAFAAVFVIAVISTAMIFSTFTDDVGADKNGKEEIRTENGVVIGYCASTEDGWVITDLDEVIEHKKTIPKLVLLNYIPYEYSFESLTIKQIETGNVTCEYIFRNKNNEVLEIEEFIPNKGEMYFEIKNVSKEIESTKGPIYIEEEEFRKATIQIDDGICISIWGILSDEEIIEIVNKMKL